jgi:hypothetical protein
VNITGYLESFIQLRDGSGVFLGPKQQPKDLQTVEAMQDCDNLGGGDTALNDDRIYPP